MLKVNSLKEFYFSFFTKTFSEKDSVSENCTDWGIFMYKRIENGWIKHLDFMILDLLGFQVAYRLSYLFLLWYDGSPNESFYSNQACVLFILQLVTSLILSDSMDGIPFLAISAV